MGECTTQIEQRHVEFKWVIQQFNLHLKRYKDSGCLKFNLKSPIFISEHRDQKIEWNFKLYIDESSEELMKKWISFNFSVSSEKSIIIDSHEVSFVDYARKKKLVGIDQKVWIFSKTGSLWYRKFLNIDKISEGLDTLLPNNTLTIIFKAVVGSEPFVVFGPKPIEPPECKVLKDYVDLFSNRKGGDITFTVGEKKIKAHKLILIARSPVFAAMFEHDMIENKKNCVNITDIKPEVFTELLRFIYTNQVCKINELAEDLLQAADKYQIEILKQICEHELFQSLNIENAAQILIHADNHNCLQLKSHAINFINKHGLDITETPVFKIMVTTHPQLVAELYTALIISSTIKLKK